MGAVRTGRDTEERSAIGSGVLALLIRVTVLARVAVLTRIAVLTRGDIVVVVGI